MLVIVVSKLEPEQMGRAVIRCVQRMDKAVIGDVKTCNVVLPVSCLPVNVFSANSFV